MFVLAEPGGEGLVLAVPRAVAPETFEALDHHLIMEDVELSMPDVVFFAAVGPQATSLSGASELASHTGEIDLVGLGTGVLFGVPADRVEAFEALLRRQIDELGGTFGDDAAFRALCIEQGVPRFGEEFDTSMLPQEASLEKRAVAFDKGCYLGQEVVYMLEHRGHPKRRLCAVDVEGAEVPSGGAPIKTPTGEVVGELKSAVRASLGRGIAGLASVKWSSAKEGTELRVAGSVARIVAIGTPRARASTT